jgi:uncharacterized protein (DUF433 family)
MRGLQVENLTDEDLDELARYRPVFDWRPFIQTDPSIAYGKPVIRGTRIAVEFLLDLFAGGLDAGQVLENYPSLTPEALRAAFAYAAECVSEKQQRPVRRPLAR